MSSVAKLWKDLFVGNPLLRREAGFAEGRPWWKAPMVWAVGMLVLSLAVSEAYQIPIAIHRSSDDTLALMRLLESMPMRAFAYANMALSALTPLLFIWIVARAWSRDSSPAHRDQIGASPLTVAQLVGARTLLWMAPLLVFGLIGPLFEVLHTALLGHSPFEGILHPDLGVTLSILRFIWLKTYGVLVFEVVLPLAILGLVTRVALMHFRPVLTLVTVGSGTALFFGWPSLFFWSMGATGGAFWIYQIIFWIQQGVIITVAIATWWGLHRHVARVYGMEQGTG